MICQGRFNFRIGASADAVILTLKLFPVPWETAENVDKFISWPKRFVNSSEAISYELNI